MRRPPRRHRRAGPDAPGGEPAGEIQARGPNVFRGYWHNPEATREAFTADGFFRTGDLGAIDADGYLHIVGRSKELIVLAGGKNIFPDEVETVYAESALDPRARGPGAERPPGRPDRARARRAARRQRGRPPPASARRARGALAPPRVLAAARRLRDLQGSAAADSDRQAAPARARATVRARQGRRACAGEGDRAVRARPRAARIRPSSARSGGGFSSASRRARSRSTAARSSTSASIRSTG